jgi:hypothetical protein
MMGGRGHREESGLQVLPPPLLLIRKHAVTACEMMALVRKAIAVADAAQQHPTPAASLLLSLQV